MTFDRQITIQRGVRQPDGTTVYSDLMSLPARVIERQGREVFTSGEAEASLADTVFIVRYRDDLRVTDRVVYNGRTYNKIERIREGRRGRRLTLEIDARSVE